MLKTLLKNKNSTGNMIFFLSSANLFNTALTLISGFLVAKWMLPEDLGLFTGFNLIIGYIILGQLGISSGLSRELPYLLGKKEYKEAWFAAEVAQFWLLYLSVISFILLTLIAIYYLINNNQINAAGFFTIAVVTFQTLYVSQYLRVLYRTNSEFNKISLIKFVTAIVSFVTILFVWKWEFYGLCLRAIVLALVSFILFWKWKPISVKPKWNKLKFIEILKVGLPMFSVANVYALWPIIQKTLILFLGGSRYLGLFVLAIMVNSSAQTISTSLNNVLYTKMVLMWGEKHSISALLKLIKKPVFTVIGILLPLFIIAWFVLPYFVTNFLNNYLEGIQAAQWMLIAAVVSVLFVYTNIYNVIKEQKDRLICYVTGIVVWAIVVITLYYVEGFSLDIFPKGIIFGQLSIFIITLYNIRKYIRVYDY